MRAWSQCNTSFNARAGTLRGMHYQAEPHGEAKLVRVTRGAVFDVIVDLRRDSATFREWFGVELDARDAGARCTCRSASPTASRRSSTTPRCSTR